MRTLTLEQVQKVYPPNPQNAGLTGYIPIDVFTKWEDEFRPFMRSGRIKAIYRGPRRGRYSSMTRREDAHSVVLYCKQENIVRTTAMVYEKLSTIGDLITMEDFVDGCHVGPCFTDYDGFGYYALENCQTRIIIKPSHVISDKYDKNFTHVMWFNRQEDIMEYVGYFCIGLVIGYLFVEIVRK